MQMGLGFQLSFDHAPCGKRVEMQVSVPDTGAEHLPNPEMGMQQRTIDYVCPHCGGEGQVTVNLWTEDEPKPQ